MKRGGLVGIFLVFDRQQLVDATEDILLNNGVPRQGTKELLEVWNGEKGK